MKKRDRIGMILYFAYLLLLCASVLLILKIALIQLTFKPDRRIETALSNRLKVVPVEPVPGDILDCEGRTISTSRAMYEIHMDCTVLAKDIQKRKLESLEKAKTQAQKDSAVAKAAREEKRWRDKAKALSKRLPEVFPEHDADYWYNAIIRNREAGVRYMKIGHPVNIYDYQKLCSFPLFEEGRFKSGMATDWSYERVHPYGNLAGRVIGFVRKGDFKDEKLTNNNIGLEGKFDYVLHGKPGKEFLRETDNGLMRDTDSTAVKAEDGKDLRSTINIDFQAIADAALREQFQGEDNIEGGTLVLMEVSTGAIRAMVNLKKAQGPHPCYDSYNFATMRAIEPGSVFKTVTLMSALSDGYVRSLDEELPTNHGRVIGGTGMAVDSHILDYERNTGRSSISILHGMEISSNYVYGSLAVKYYKDNPDKFIQNIHSYHLSDKFDFDLDGLVSPRIPAAGRDFHVADLGNMGFGYTTSETPLHMLAFYNAIANKGRMMKPYLVEDIEKDGKVIEYRGPGILSASICTEAVADTIGRALRSVVTNGTAKVLRNAKLPVAGKTGTSFGTFKRSEGWMNGVDPYVNTEGKRKYQGTFVGYFPADNPQYSIICTIYSYPTPTNYNYQGGSIPARAVKTVVNTLYNVDPKFRKTLNEND